MGSLIRKQDLLSFLVSLVPSIPFSSRFVRNPSSCPTCWDRYLDIICLVILGKVAGDSVLEVDKCPADV